MSKFSSLKCGASNAITSWQGEGASVKKLAEIVMRAALGETRNVYNDKPGTYRKARTRVLNVLEIRHTIAEHIKKAQELQGDDYIYTRAHGGSIPLTGSGLADWLEILTTRTASGAWRSTIWATRTYARRCPHWSNNEAEIEISEATPVHKKNGEPYAGSIVEAAIALQANYEIDADEEKCA
jgi:hypothetical protein